MLVVQVDIQVKSEQVAQFMEASLANARASLTEPGVLRFDVIVDEADPTHVVLVEVYRDTGAAAAHKETAHYTTWRDAVAPMMARPRSSTKFSAAFPIEPQRWIAQS